MDTDFTTASTISHYRITRHLGRGGMGDVYLADDERLGRQVAIKCIRSDMREKSLAKRLRHEAKLLAKLNHPNIIQIYDIIDEVDQLALVMEYVDGLTLRKHCYESLQSLDQQMFCLAAIASGLSAAHEAGIVHRDLKADNILVASNGVIKITDFGIAKPINEAVTQYGQVTGSYSSISPEQAMGLAVDNRSDLFALGILAYKMIFGSHPFGDKENHLVTVQRILHEPYITPPEKLTRDLPEGMIILLDRLLAKQADDRPDSTAWVANQLYEYANSVCGYENTHTETVDLSKFMLHLNKPISNVVTNLNKIKHTVENHTSIIRRIKRFFIPTIIFFMLLAAGSFIYSKFINKQDVYYIAVLPPVLKSNEIENTQNKLVQTAVYSSLQQAIVKLDGLELIPSNEIQLLDGSLDVTGKGLTKDEINGSILSTAKAVSTDNINKGVIGIAKAVGADEIISSTLQCQALRCQVTLERLSGARWTVQQQRHYPVLNDTLLKVSEISQNQLSLLYPNLHQLESAHQMISENDYRRYLELYQTSMMESSNRNALLDEIKKLQARAVRFEPVYHLYRETALHLYADSQEKQYLDELESVLLTADSIFPNNINHKLNWFWLSISQRDGDRALYYIDQIEKLGGGEETVATLRAKLLFNDGKYNEAVQLYRRAIELRPNRHLYYDLAFTLWQSGNIDEAKKTIESLLILSPDDYLGNRLLATIALSAGDLQQAIKAYDAMLSRNPESLNYNNLGLAYMLQGNFLEAHKYFKQAVNQNPNNAIWLLNLADTEKLLGNETLAADYYQQVMDLINDKDDWESLLLKAQIFAHLQQSEHAVIALQQAQKLVANNAEFAFNAALVYTLIGEITSALVQIQNSLDSGVGTVWYRLPWFNKLCKHDRFSELLADSGDPTRCHAL